MNVTTSAINDTDFGEKPDKGIRSEYHDKEVPSRLDGWKIKTEDSSDKKANIVGNESQLTKCNEDETSMPTPFQHKISCDTIDRIKATLYGQCVGDAIGILTEFMTIEEANVHYGHLKELEFKHKIPDGHRDTWKAGDWTDDSDQMILLLDSLVEENGKIVPQTFAYKLDEWIHHGFQELGDKCGYGIGRLTYTTVSQQTFTTSPQKVAENVWKESGRSMAPNGALMRSSIMGIHEFWDTEKVICNAVEMCKTTHFDPRCQASVAAFCSAISMMLQKGLYNNGCFDVEEIIQKARGYGHRYLHDNPEFIKEIDFYMNCKDIQELHLDGPRGIGYTFKCLGAGFWALRQDNFREALQIITMQAGDADTNCAVAGALLACKLGTPLSLPESWVNNLYFKHWLDMRIERYLKLLKEMYNSYIQVM